jgi:hypothetical protein
MSEKIKHDEKFEPRDQRFGGLLLIGVGLLVLLANVTRADLFGNLVLPGLGIIFLVWAFYTHRIGFAIPGCILTGLGVGVLITQRVPSLAGELSGGVIVLGLAAGFLGITLITPLFNEKRAWWGLIPGGILGLVGLLLIIGGDALRWLELLGYLWPLILVVIGVYILFGPRFRHQ